MISPYIIVNIRDAQEVIHYLSNIEDKLAQEDVACRNAIEKLCNILLGRLEYGKDGLLYAVEKIEQEEES